MKITSGIAAFIALALSSAVTLAAEHPKAWIAIHFGKLDPTFEEVLDRTFMPRLETLRGTLKHRGIDFRPIIRNSEAPLLVSDLSDPSVLGVIWVGDVAAVESKQGAAFENLFLMTGSKRYLPKSIFSAAHEQLQFVSLVSCHRLSQLYSRGLPSGVEMLIPPKFEVDNDNEAKAPQDDLGFFQLTNILTGPNNSLGMIEAKIPTFMDKFLERASSTEEAPPKLSLEIRFRDLLSTRFQYEVLLDGKFVGAMTYEKGVMGAKTGTVTQAFPIPSGMREKMKSGSVLTIRQDDLERPRGNIQNVVDDILVEGIALVSHDSREELIEQSVHIGDDSDSVDGPPVSLSSHENAQLMREIPVVRELLIPLR